MDGEVDMVQCFFDPSHMIFRSRFPYHYQRCSRQYPNVRHKVCPYSGMHILKPEDYDAHVAKCEAKPLIEPSVPAVNQVQAPVDSWEEGADSWGTEEPTVPQIAQRDQFVYSSCIGGSKAEKVQHRLTGRRQYGEMEEAKKSTEADSNKKKKNKKKKKKSQNSKSNTENINGASGNKPVRTNAGNKPLAERKSSAFEIPNLAALTIND